jgi:hypothetical protein
MGHVQRLAPGRAIDNSPGSLEDDFESEVFEQNPYLTPACQWQRRLWPTRCVVYGPSRNRHRPCAGGARERAYAIRARSCENGGGSRRSTDVRKLCFRCCSV